jgi:hypothetical protein
MKKGLYEGGVLLIIFGVVLNIAAKFHVGCRLNLIITTNHGFIYNITIEQVLMISQKLKRSN